MPSSIGPLTKTIRSRSSREKMSNARSPRLDSSTTIGTRFIASGLMRPSSSLRRWPTTRGGLHGSDDVRSPGRGGRWSGACRRPRPSSISKLTRLSPSRVGQARSSRSPGSALRRPRPAPASGSPSQASRSSGVARARQTFSGGASRSASNTSAFGDRRRSLVHLLQHVLQALDALRPEGAVAAEPVDQRREALPARCGSRPCAPRAARRPARPPSAPPGAARPPAARSAGARAAPKRCARRRSAARTPPAGSDRPGPGRCRIRTWPNDKHVLMSCASGFRG